MNAIIIEDEQLVARALQAKITAIEPSIKVMAILPSLKTARRWLMENAEPDLMFMDIQLGDGVSFKLFDDFNLKCPVIFTTAYNEYAINAFKANGIDYLLKPIEEKELRRAIEKSITLHNTMSLAPADILRLIESVRTGSKSALYKEKFLVNVRHQLVPVNTTDIAFFYKDALHYLVLDGHCRFALHRDVCSVCDPVAKSTAHVCFTKPCRAAGKREGDGDV